MTAAPTDGYLDGSPWNARQTTAVFLAWLVGGLVGGIVADAVGFDPLNEAAGLAIAIAFQSAAALLAVTLYSQSAASGSLRRDVGLALHPRHWYGLLLGFAIQIAVGLLLLPLADLLDETDTQAVSDLAADTLDSAGRVLLFISFVVAAPVVEEVLFRGVLLGWLTKRMNQHVAVAISSLAFGLAHFESSDLLLPVIGLTLLAVPLAYAALRVGNLSLSIAMHAGINLLAFLVLVFGDGIVEQVDQVSEQTRAAVGLLLRSVL